MKMIYTPLLLVFALPFAAQANCIISRTDGSPARNLQDPLSHLLSAAANCPQDVGQLRTLLSAQGLRTFPSMVANRGFGNPSGGSFSFFERVVGGNVRDGQFFFGHFTAAHGNTLTLDQANANGKLMIELIAWDSGKGLYNFYEMIGDTPAPRWFYRGDSADILSDTRMVQLPMNNPQPFGSRLRCSGCHASGGPIMKEISAPFNDWWTKSRPLPFGSLRPDSFVTTQLSQIQDASSFANAVRTGIFGLESSPRYQAAKRGRSLAEQLRPLFCENEINLASDMSPSAAGGAFVEVPPSFFGHPAFWGEIGGRGPIKAPSFRMSRGMYSSLTAGLRFPETGAPDADHAWLTPVRNISDEAAVGSLLQQGVINEKFLLDVLAVDSSHPLFSVDRCALLALVPHAVSGSWVAAFVANLSRSTLPSAKILRDYLSDPAWTPAVHRAAESARLQAVAASLATATGARAAVQMLVMTRAAARTSAISRNPRGQILEPGFRVIFPVPVSGRF